MGNPNSKAASAKKDVSADEGSLPSTPILTPKAKLIDNDPRSPSANIARTPIYSTMDINAPETPIIGVLHSDNQETSSVSIDPRSPTVEFTRTPIVVENQPIKLRNKNLECVKQQSLSFSPANKIVNTLNNSKGPKLISVTPITKKVDQNEKRKSFVGLLETNLDFVETDIDKVTRLNNSYSITEDKVDIFEDLPKISEDANEPKEKISKTETFEEIIVNITPPFEENPISFEDLKSPIELTLQKISQIDEEIKEIITYNPPVIDLDEELESQEFDKKVANLIYEDQELTNIINKTIKNKDDCRTPLSERNGNQQNKKLSSDKRIKKDYSVSKIPVFKEKKGKSKIPVQCENTPPKQKNNTKPRRGQWDTDKTMII